MCLEIELRPRNDKETFTASDIIEGDVVFNNRKGQRVLNVTIYLEGHTHSLQHT